MGNECHICKKCLNGTKEALISDRTFPSLSCFFFIRSAVHRISDVGVFFSVETVLWRKWNVLLYMFWRFVPSRLLFSRGAICWTVLVNWETTVQVWVSSDCYRQFKMFQFRPRWAPIYEMWLYWLISTFKEQLHYIVVF